MKPDGQGLDDHQLRQIREHARKALEKAGALGCFPTPVDGCHRRGEAPRERA